MDQSITKPNTKSLYVCQKCNRIIVNYGRGFVIYGNICTADPDGEVVLTTPSVLCLHCLFQTLQLDLSPILIERVQSYLDDMKGMAEDAKE